MYYIKMTNVYILRGNKLIKVKSNENEKQNDCKNNNFKKMICKSIVNNNYCVYGDKCMYAHNLGEQQIEPIRKIAYDMVKNDTNLGNINVNNNMQLYNALKSLTNLCTKCVEKKCTGGYNCKNGACKPEYVICLMDLNKGNCDGTCDNVHLTNKGFIPFGFQLIDNKIKRAKINITKNKNNDNDEMEFVENIVNVRIERKKNASIFKIDLSKVDI